MLYAGFILGTSEKKCIYIFITFYQLYKSIYEHTKTSSNTFTSFSFLL